MHHVGNNQGCTVQRKVHWLGDFARKLRNLRLCASLLIPAKVDAKLVHFRISKVGEAQQSWLLLEFRRAEPS